MADDRYYDKGDKIRLHARFTVNGDLRDPTTITLIIKDPDDTETQFTYANNDIVRESQGAYYYDHTISKDITAGAWHYRFESTGVVNSAAEKTFIVYPSHFD
jgi:uncharacterized protein YfaS (alpha-2-macroglobulin family)